MKEKDKMKAKGKRKKVKVRMKEFYLKVVSASLLPFAFFLLPSKSFAEER
jgi:hypothetical protein